ncbi:plasmid pRiA4b ORF-3 family protein [Acidaminobacter sp. JC074]|uniref:plasmid pRiA4b ORF-3 family protein n=1 Tax=Acidaminobacter sp. JC074 TaxID=2530199 RepID=UPI001F0F486C|nr:plasmid pRiA4b ORF-3 family protein [Acidaminobacter sp. JC074]MCH4888575.1 plasmid pRiA4b ORF-3 family protein [Acidaminobacter sp. JC074]
MQIALTKKLADGLKLKPPAADETIDPIFTWTANWICVWSNRSANDMLVLVNNKTRFTVAVYEVKRKNLKDVEAIIMKAIKNTLLSMSFNPDMVDKYMDQAGQITFVKNSDRKASSWVSKSGQELTAYIGRTYNGVDNVYDDMIARNNNYMYVNFTSGSGEFMPYKAMADALSELTGHKPYKNKAYELTVTLDLEVYKAIRKIIVPAEMDFFTLHQVIQNVYKWNDEHLFEFAIANGEFYPPMLFVDKEDQYELGYYELMNIHKRHKLSEIFSNNKEVIYTYDLGDCWQHKIELTNVLEAYDKELPYLLEASGQTPPENVGGVGGFIEFRKVMLDDKHPDHKGYKRWAPLWRIELSEWHKKEKVIHLW